MAVQKIKRVEDEALWAKSTMKTLETVKESFSDKPDSESNEYVAEELEFLLADVGAQSGELRNKLLVALDAETTKFSFLFAEELNTPNQTPDRVGDCLIMQMEAIWKKASLGEREQIQQRLGLVTTSQKQFDEQVARKLELFEDDIVLPESQEEWASYELAFQGLCDALKVKEAKRFSMLEILNLLSKSVESLSDLKEVYTNVWDSYVSREDKSQMSLPRLGPLEVQCVRKLEGELTNQAVEEIDQLKKVALAVVFALNKGASEFGVYYNQRYAPENIENAVLIGNQMSSADKVKNIELKYWQKYEDLAKNITADYIDEEFQKIFGKMMVNWITKR